MRALVLSLTFVAAASAQCELGPVGFDTHDVAHRSPFGAVPVGTPVFLAVHAPGISSARVRVWDAVARAERWHALEREGERWTVALRADAPNILYYLFELTPGDGCAPHYLLDEDPRFTGGGTGVTSAGLDTLRSFQITVYDDAHPRTWLADAVVYQIFVDRFRDGDADLNLDAPRFYYGRDTVWRSHGEAWNTRVCDPTETREPACRGTSSGNLYGGDLAGITAKVESGYFDALGVSALYLTPIFHAPSNHKYDTTDYRRVDPEFGDAAAFDDLVAALRARRMRLVLDGVFNHVSSDSPYFDGFGRFDEVGACEAVDSPFRDWFYLPDIGSPGRSGGRPIECAGGQTYEAWFGFSALPKLRAEHPAVRALVWDAPDAVAPTWSARGADGWRLDVAGDIDAGRAGTPENDFWEGFRAAVRAEGDVVVIGEEWSDASRWLLGGEWDSAMNYRLRSTLLGWLAVGCEGDGCRGGALHTNDENEASSSGPIAPLPPTVFHARLMSIHEDYPPLAHRSMLNLVGSHDTNRVGFLLERTGSDRWGQLWAFLFTYPGAPMLYYGDEVGLSEAGVYRDGVWRDDPFNRAPFPWPDTPGFYEADAERLRLVRRLSALRWSHAALREGDIEHGWAVDDASGLYGFRRTAGEATAVVLLNRGASAAEVGRELPPGVVDPFAGTPSVPGGGWRVFATPGDTIAAPVVEHDGGVLRWAPVREDTDGGREVALAYEIARDGAPFATVEPPPFGGPLEVALDGPARYGVRAVGVWGAGPEVVVDLRAEADAGPPPRRDGGPPPPQDAGRFTTSSEPPAPEPTAGGCRQVPWPCAWWWLALVGCRRARLLDDAVVAHLVQEAGAVGRIEAVVGGVDEA